MASRAQITAPALPPLSDAKKDAVRRLGLENGSKRLLVAHLIHGHWIHSPKALREAFEAAGVPMLPMDAMPIGEVAKRLVERLSR